jgi:TolA-binding protein
MRSFLYIISRRAQTAFFLILIEGFLLALFPPSLIFDPTLTTGGDTLSHYLAAESLRERMFSGESLVSWIHGNYAGFPLFLNYFPLPFAIMALLSLVTSLQVAFKLGTLLAILPLPAAVYGCVKRLGYSSGTALLGSGFSVLFLVMTENSMWGGNIASTLAGEFAYGMSFIVAIYLIGKLYHDVPRNRSLVSNSFLEALVALGNGYPLLQVGLGSLFFALRLSTFRYVVLLHAIAVGMISFWLLPLLFYLPWDTAFAHSWSFEGWRQVAPSVLWPAFFGIPAGWLMDWLHRAERGRPFMSSDGAGPEAYLWWQITCALLGFGLSPLLGLADIRFLPFAQMLLVILGAIGWGKVLERLRYTEALSALMILGVLTWASFHLGPIPSWVRWNYSGMEAKPLWSSLRDVSGYLRGSPNDPRVMYEHADANNDMGTVRAFEMLPHFSGRSTLEGLYMQSSVTSPFVFYVQSELSQTPSCPFPDYYYGRFDTHRGAAHLRLFNVNQLIAITEQTTAALDRSEDFIPEVNLSPFRIYRVVDSDESYVVPLRYLPHRIPLEGWKKTQFEWLRKSSLDVPLLVAPEDSPGGYWLNAPSWNGPPEDLSRTPLYDPSAEQITASARLETDRIVVETSRVGHPLWLKVSYHPRWEIEEGEGELYLASPSFMILVPHTPLVTLRFNTHGGVFTWGRVITLLTWVSVLAALLAARGRRRPIGGQHSRQEEDEKGPEDNPLWEGSRSSTPQPAEQGEAPDHQKTSKWLRFAVWALLAGVAAFAASQRTELDPILLYNRGVKAYEEAEKDAEKDAVRQDARRKEPMEKQADAAILRRNGSESAAGSTAQRPEERFDEARRLFYRCIEKYPLSPVTDYAVHYLALIYMAEQEWRSAEQLLDTFLQSHPDSRIYPEALYHLGVCGRYTSTTEASNQLFWQLVAFYPDNPWASHAAVRLMETTRAEDLLDVAERYFGQGDYATAAPLLAALSRSESPTIRREGSLLLARSQFHQNRWEEASRLLTEWLQTYPDDRRVGDALLNLAQCHLFMGQYELSHTHLLNAAVYDPSIRRTPSYSAMLELTGANPDQPTSPTGHPGP